MPQTSTLQTEIGSALRELAAIVDTVPALDTARMYPQVELILHVGVTTRSALEQIAADLGSPVGESPVDHHIWADVSTGTVVMRLYTYDLERELHRPCDVVAPGEVLEP